MANSAIRCVTQGYCDQWAVIVTITVTQSPESVFPNPTCCARCKTKRFRGDQDTPADVARLKQHIAVTSRTSALQRSREIGGKHEDRRRGRQRILIQALAEIIFGRTLPATDKAFARRLKLVDSGVKLCGPSTSNP